MDTKLNDWISDVCQVGGLAAQRPSGLAASSAIFRYAAYVDLRNQGIIESRFRRPFKWYQLYYAHFKDENVNKRKAKTRVFFEVLLSWRLGFCKTVKCHREQNLDLIDSYQ